MSWSGTGGMGREREDELSIVKPGNSVLGGIELIDVVDKPVLLGEFFQVNDQGLAACSKGRLCG